MKTYEECEKRDAQAGNRADEGNVKEISVSFGGGFDAVLEAQIRKCLRWKDGGRC